jgi:hypothetical protein
MMSISLRKEDLIRQTTVLSAFDSSAMADVLAALCHQRGATFALVCPVSTDIGVCKMPVTDRLEMLDIDELS